MPSRQLRAWARGTQALIGRFDGRYDVAEGYVREGLRHAPAGENRIRLLAGLAQSRANLGDSPGANDMLDEAERERGRVKASAAAKGPFAFSRAKQLYYGGSSLMWLPGRRDSARAARDAQGAIATWQSEPPETRSLSDEHLAHLYLATALIRLGDLPGAEAAVRVVLDLAPERKISWIRKRLADLAGLLGQAPFAGSREAAELAVQLRS